MNRWRRYRSEEGYTCWEMHVLPIEVIYYATMDGPDGSIEPVALHGDCRFSPDVAVYDMAVRRAQREVLAELEAMPGWLEAAEDDVQGFLAPEIEAALGALRVAGVEWGGADVSSSVVQLDDEEDG